MHALKPFLCPYCGEMLDAAVHYANQNIEPVPGAIGVCMACALPHLFLSDMSTRILEPEEMADRDPAELRELARMMLMVGEQIAERPTSKRPKPKAH